MDLPTTSLSQRSASAPPNAQRGLPMRTETHGSAHQHTVPVLAESRRGSIPGPQVLPSWHRPKAPIAVMAVGRAARSALKPSGCSVRPRIRPLARSEPALRRAQVPLRASRSAAPMLPGESPVHAGAHVWRHTRDKPRKGRHVPSGLSATQGQKAPTPRARELYLRLAGGPRRAPRARNGRGSVSCRSRLVRPVARSARLW